MRHFPATPIEMISTLWRHRVLIFISTKREVLGRYRGSFLGLLWSFFNPIFMLSVYTFVFSEVFKAHWGNNTGSRTEFALVLFAGLIVFNIFAECVNKSPGLIIANPNYVKKIVFPLEILPFVVLLSSLFHASISLLDIFIIRCLSARYHSVRWRHHYGTHVFKPHFLPCYRPANSLSTLHLLQSAHRSG